MQFDFDEQQSGLAESVRAVLDSECPIALSRDIVERSDTSGAGALWAQISDLGWPALTVPETAGGLGLGTVEACIVYEELGRHLAPVPFVTTVGGLVPALVASGSTLHSEVLQAVANGEATGALIDGDVRATSQADASWTLDGTARFVLAGASLSHLAIIAATDAGEQAFVVDANVAEFEPVDAFDASRQVSNVRLDAVQVTGSAAVGSAGDEMPATMRRHACLALAAETLGVCQSLFERTLAYVKEREQFGVAIGSFQAVKHKIVDVFVAVEKLRALVYFASLTLDEGDPRAASAVSMAKAAGGDTSRLACKEAIQLHGGIGYTWESDIHLFVKRAKTADALFGSPAKHRSRVGQLAF